MKPARTKLKELLPLLTQLCPQHSQHLCVAVRFIAGQAGAVVKIINSLGGDATCAKNEIALYRRRRAKETAKVPPSPSLSLTPSRTVTPTRPPPSLPDPPASAPAGHPPGAAQLSQRRAHQGHAREYGGSDAASIS
jgi:hypothetical protein